MQNNNKPNKPADSIHFVTVLWAGEIKSVVPPKEKGENFPPGHGHHLGMPAMMAIFGHDRSVGFCCTFFEQIP